MNNNNDFTKLKKIIRSEKHINSKFLKILRTKEDKRFN